ncbi:hypothetical protein HO133_002901 [Letharia lupina]|uniref:Rhodopsin domain-containing protein n=1 Tax=Letharia lupina TaxID=560253 RepID=A0A8H6CBM7_9LECA|nr:uncharacterized protein HO133_002901 [Letharia lupina]KAF6220469.1 hypothetical protein HO133_002901 [Letharia lupina]
MGLTITYSVFFTLYAAKGGARHFMYLTPAQVEETTLFNWVSQTFCIMAIATGKISVAILMGRLMAPNRWRKRILYFLSISAFIAACIFIISIFAQCSPPKALWIPSPGKCPHPKKINDLDVALACWFVFVDFALAIFGITMIWNLQLNKRKKAGLSALLGLGFFAGICAAVKTSYLPTLTVHSDFSWITVDLLIWNALEVNVIIFAACLPTLRPIFKTLFDNIQVRVSMTRKSHSKLPSPRHESSYELQTVPTKIVRPANSASRGAADSWPNENSSRVNIVPTNRILEVTEMDTRFEDRSKDGKGKDEEYGWNESRAATSTRNVV